MKLALPIGSSEAVPGLFDQDTAGPRAVKNVRISLFNLVFTQVFTLWPRTPLKENAMAESKPQKQRLENYQNGPEGTPLFRLSAAQKVRGVAPALFNKTRQLHCRVHRR